MVLDGRSLVSELSSGACSAAYGFLMSLSPLQDFFGACFRILLGILIRAVIITSVEPCRDISLSVSFESPEKWGVRKWGCCYSVSNLSMC